MAPHSSPLPTPASSASQDVRGLYWVAGTGAVLSAAQSLHYNRGTLLLDPFWVRFYLVNYQDGFRRRALVGSLCRIVFPGGINILLINVVSVVVALLCVGVFVWALCRLRAQESTWRTRLFVFAICASALTGIFTEVLGDMLQVAILLFCGVTLGLGRRLRSETMKLCVGLAVTVVCFFIHEASAFFLIPALPFFMKVRPRWKDFIVPAVMFVLLMTVSLRLSLTFPHPTYRAFLMNHQLQMGEISSTPALKWEWAFEYRMNYSSSAAFLSFLERVGRAVVLVFVSLVALAQCLPRRRFERCLSALGAILLFSLPLWLIAHDWGRFFGYTFFLALASSAAWRVDAHDGTAEPVWVECLADGICRAGHMQLLQLGVLLVLLTSANPVDAHIEGLHVPMTWAFCGFLVLALVVQGWEKWRRTAR